MYDTKKPAIQERDLVRLCVDGNQFWIRNHGTETVSIYAVREGAAGFSIVKGGVGEIGTGYGEWNKSYPEAYCRVRSWWR